LEYLILIGIEFKTLFPRFLLGRIFNREDIIQSRKCLTTLPKTSKFTAHHSLWGRHIRRMGCLKRTPKSYQDPVLWVKNAKKKGKEQHPIPVKKPVY